MHKTFSIHLLAAAFALLLSPIVLAQDEPLIETDRTGVEWEPDFEQALETASEDVRLLMIKPVAFGTSPDGSW